MFEWCDKSMKDTKIDPFLLSILYFNAQNNFGHQFLPIVVIKGSCQGQHESNPNGEISRNHHRLVYRILELSGV